MKNTSKILFAASVGFGMLSMTAMPVLADTSTTTPASPSASLGGPKQGFLQHFVSALATRFNLNPADVQQFVKTQLAERKVQVEVKQEQKEMDRLAKAVAAGKLTQAQADLIKAEQVSVKAQLDALKGKTGSDLKTALQGIRTSVLQWAQTNNIPPQFVNFVLDMGPGMGRGFKIGVMMGRSEKRDND